MPWARLDDRFSQHPKVLSLSHRAFRVHVTAIIYCAANLTDGVISDAALRIIAATAGVSSLASIANELATAGLWHAHDQGWMLHDWSEYNPSADEVKRQRKQAAERQRRHRHGVTHGEPSRGRADPPHPTPGFASLEEPSRDAAPREGAEHTPRAADPTTIGRLVAACGGGSARTKIARTVRCYALAEADVAWALESATGPNVREPLAVALAELKRRGEERRGSAA